jgi:hypothetical protein
MDLDRHFQTVRELLTALTGTMLLEVPNGADLLEQVRGGSLQAAITFLPREAAVTLTVFDPDLDGEPTPLLAWSLRSLAEAGVVLPASSTTH